MLIQSPEYNQEMRNLIRKPIDININLELINEEAQTYSTAISQYSSEISQTNNIGRLKKEYSYASGENRGFILGRGQLILPDNLINLKYQGFESSILSNENGIFDTIPFIEMSYSGNRILDIPGIGLTFDNIMNTFPKRIRIKTESITEVILDKEFELDSSELMINENFNNVKKITIYFLETLFPRQRTRLSHIYFGTNILFNSENIEQSGATREEEIDPIMRRLPTKKFSWNFFMEDRFDPENVSGLWKHFKDKSKIKINYLQKLSNNSVENINGGIFYLNTIPTIINNKITVTGTGLFQTLNKLFYKSNNFLYSGGVGKPFYEIAEDIFIDARISSNNYYIDESLRDYRTNAPMPQTEHKNCLKLIAEACNCIIFEGIDEIIRIIPNNLIKHDFKLDLDEMWNNPTLITSPKLYSIENTLYTYKIEEEEKEILNTEVSVIEEVELTIPFENAYITNVSGTALWTSYDLFDNSIHFYDFSSGTVILTGHKIITTEKKQEIIYNPDGETENIKNPLITNNNQLQEVVEFKVNYLSKRNTWSINSRGFPELENSDLINIQTKFIDSLESRILSNKIVFKNRNVNNSEYIVKEM